VRLALQVRGASQPFDVTVHDVAGRLVRELARRRELREGRHELRWDGLDAQGRAVSQGVYLLTVRSPDGARTRPITRLD
jgi:hypothetical protein